jgi:Co/Zn/Cd efflux system component
MSAHCDHCQDNNATPAQDPRYRKVLWAVLGINAVMFGVEIVAGFRADSTSLLADSLDFLGDAVNYGLSLWVLSMVLLWRARAALLKGATMLVFGVFVIGKAWWNLKSGALPVAATMGSIGTLALLANLSAAALLYAWREGDANMRSVWLCTRNDAIGNLAVLAAALGVWGSASAWPDAAVAAVMATLAISSGWQVVKLARQEIARSALPGMAHAPMQQPPHAHGAHDGHGH